MAGQNQPGSLGFPGFIDGGVRQYTNLAYQFDALAIPDDKVGITIKINWLRLLKAFPPPRFLAAQHFPGND